MINNGSGNMPVAGDNVASSVVQEARAWCKDLLVDYDSNSVNDVSNKILFYNATQSIHNALRERYAYSDDLAIKNAHCAPDQSFARADRTHSFTDAMTGEFVAVQPATDSIYRAFTYDTNGVGCKLLETNVIYGTGAGDANNNLILRYVYQSTDQFS
jgi:hypothetical protein